MFREVICFVAGSFFPNQVVHALFDAVSHPIEAHVEGFRQFLAEGFRENAASGRIIGFELGAIGRLCVAEFNGGGADGNAFFPGHVDASCFGFGR